MGFKNKLATGGGTYIVLDIYIYIYPFFNAVYKKTLIYLYIHIYIYIYPILYIERERECRK